MTVQEYVDVLEIIECGHQGCGVTFGLTSSYVTRRRQDHQSFYCPNGHSRYYPQKSDLELEREARTTAEADAKRTRSLLQDEREQHKRTENRLRSTRGVVTRTKRRIADGACPRCHERFPNLEAHMTAKHPDYAEPRHLA